MEDSPWLEDAFFRVLCSTMIQLRKDKSDTEEKQARSRGGSRRPRGFASPFVAGPKASSDEHYAMHSVLMDMEIIWRRELKRVVTQRKQLGCAFVVPSVLPTSSKVEHAVRNEANIKEHVKRELGELIEENAESAPIPVHPAPPILPWFEHLSGHALQFLQQCKYKPPEVQSVPSAIVDAKQLQGLLIALSPQHAVRPRLEGRAGPRTAQNFGTLDEMQDASEEPVDIFLQEDEEVDEAAFKSAVWDPDGICGTVRNTLACSVKHGTLAHMRFSNALLHIDGRGEIAVARVLLHGYDLKSKKEPMPIL